MAEWMLEITAVALLYNSHLFRYIQLKFEMSVFINEGDGVADLMKSDLICTSNDWLDTQRGICFTNAIYLKDNCVSSKQLISTNMPKEFLKYAIFD